MSIPPNLPPLFPLLSSLVNDQSSSIQIEISPFVASPSTTPPSLESAEISEISRKILKNTNKPALADKLKKVCEALQMQSPAALKTLETTYNEIPNEEKSLFITTLLKVFNGHQDQDKTSLIFSYLKHVYKELDLYFVFSKDGRTFTTKGIELLVNYLKTNKMMDSEFNCIVCDDCESFDQELEKLENAPLNSKFGFIVRCQSKESQKIAHMTGLFLQKTSIGWQALQLDAAGHESAFLPFMVLQSKMKVEIFHGGEGRQRNYTSCAIFALHDLATLSFESDIFSSLKKEGCHEMDNLSIKLDLENLPLDLIKVTENAARLNQIAKKKFASSCTPEAEQAIFFGSMAKYLIQNPSEQNPINDLIRRLHCKYEKLIVEHCFNELLPSWSNR